MSVLNDDEPAMWATPQDRQKYCDVLNNLVRSAGRSARDHGFHERFEDLQYDYGAGHLTTRGYVARLNSELSTSLMMAVGELVEAQDELRSGTAPLGDRADVAPGDAPHGFRVELVDALIRILDLLYVTNRYAPPSDDALVPPSAGALLVDKMTYNASRPVMHGKVF